MKKKILIVDDSKIEQLVLSGFLRSEYDVIISSNGEEALEILNRDSGGLSAVIMDLMMPGMTGYDVIAHIRNGQVHQQIPIIITTSLSDEESREKAVAYGANGYVTKPYSQALLLHSLKNAIQLQEAVEIVNMLRRDDLTGLLNRESFFTETRKMISRHEPGYYMLSCFDVDNFKVINDQYGINRGDEALRYIASVINGFVAGNGGLVCRFTADKFAILYPAAIADSDEIRKNHERVSELKCINHRIRFRIGRYAVTDLSIPVSSMFDRATLAAESIRGRYDIYIADYSDNMRNVLLQEQKIVNDMAAAITDGEFEVWFQPQYNHATGALIGSEALVRWRKDGKIVPPCDFIPTFERNGFIYELDQYVWRQVCTLLRRWLDEGRDPLPVSVNISRYDIFQIDFFSVICGLVQEYRLPAGLLRLEVTESAFTESTKTIVHVVNQLIAFGFTVEIDDFGSGYSSLNTLKDVPASILKLDMKFLSDSGSSGRGGSILESVVRMARWLGMAVIAEGVETLDQADYLESIGCEYIQGYLYGKPMTRVDYEALCASSENEHCLSRLKTVDTWNNSAFWDPKSIETLIFNSYVGGACVFEYINGKTELLRFNDRYIQELGGNIKCARGSEDSDPMSRLDEENHAILLENIETAIRNEHESTCEVKLTDDSGHDIYLRSTVRLIARALGRCLFYCVIQNITGQREAEALLRFLNSSAHDILAQPDSNRAIDDTLRRLMEYFAADRSYIIELDYENRVTNNTYEVCAAGVSREMDNLQGTPIELSEYWTEELKRHDYYCIEDVASMPDDKSGLREVLAAQNIRSLVVSPLRRDGELIGYAGIDNPTRSTGQLDRLTALSDYLAVLLTRRDLALTIARNNDDIQRRQRDLLDNLPCGAALYLYNGKSITSIHINRRYSLLVNRDAGHIASESPFDSIYPEDRQSVIDELTGAIKENRDAACDVRILYGQTEYRPFHIDAIIAPDGDGTYKIYATYSVISQNELNLRETLPFIFSSIMSSSTDLSYAKDGSFRYLCCSRAFAELLGLENQADIVGKTDYELFEKDIADRFRSHDSDLIETGTPLIDIEEHIPDKSGKLHYTQLSKYIVHNTVGEVIGLYASGRDITESRETYAQLKLITESIPGGLATFACSPEGIRVVYCNHGYCQLFGVTYEEYQKNCSSDPILYVYKKDGGVLKKQYHRLLLDGTPIDCVYRIHVKGGGFKWIHHRAQIADRHNNTVFINAALFDVTERQEIIENLRISEEESRLAIAHSGNIITKFDVRRHTLTVPDNINPVFALPPVLRNVPDEQITLGRISPDTAEAYRNLFDSICHGCDAGTATFRQNSEMGWRWLEAQYTTVFSSDNATVSAVITFADVTERLEKEIVFKKWQQSLDEKDDNLFTLFRCNLTQNGSIDNREGNLITEDFYNNEKSFSDCTAEYVQKHIFDEDKEKFLSLMNTDRLLANYQRGHRSDTLEYRESTGGDAVRWLRLTLDLVEYPNSKDIEAYLMFENIDEKKKAELLTRRRAETDPLTSALNRTSFISCADRLLHSSATGGNGAMFMLDIDDFKHINDTLGHGEGDRVLTVMTEQIRLILRRSDLLGRIGGDEFIIYLRDITGTAAAAKKAEQIRGIRIPTDDPDINVTVSIGIAMIPRDGSDFDTLYRHADAALYAQKRDGKNGYRFYDGGSTDSET